VREHRGSTPEGAGPGSRARRRTPLPSGLPRAITSHQAVEGGDMARKRPAPKYAGALAQPIYMDSLSLLDLASPDSLKEMWQKRVAEKMRLLFKHYKIDQSDELRLQRLAIILACEHVPGLQLALRPKSGRKPTWKTGLGDKLVGAVEDVKSRTGMRTEDAIAELQKEPGGMWERYTVENLGARYWEAKHHQEKLRKLVEEVREPLTQWQILPELLGLLPTDEN
jgi:hypothetical protein